MIESIDQPTRFTLHQLAVFVATAQGGSTRAAAQRVARSQSAASAALSELELALGAPLFDRLGRRLALNEQGRALLPRAAALLQQASELQSLFGQARAGPLRVAASLTIAEHLLPPRIAAWRARHPEHPVQMVVGNTAAVIQAVVEVQVELGFVEGRHGHPELRWRDWLSDELVLVAAPGSPWATRRQGVRALRQAPWIQRELGSGTRQAADLWLQQHLGEVRADCELGSTEAVKQLAAAGAGLACLSRHAVAQDLRSGRLALVRSGLPPARRQLAVVTHRQRTLGRAAAAFLAECLAEPPVRG